MQANLDAMARPGGVYLFNHVSSLVWLPHPLSTTGFRHSRPDLASVLTPST